MHIKRLRPCVLLVIALLTGCIETTTYCPTLSHDITGLLPTEYIKSKVRFLCENDTIVFQYGNIVRSKLRVFKHAMFANCYLSAYMEGKSVEGSRIKFTIEDECIPTEYKVYNCRENIFHTVEVDRVILSQDTLSVLDGVMLDLNTWNIKPTGRNPKEKLDLWISKTGRKYSPVFKLTTPGNDNDSSTVFYLSPGYGLVEIEWQDGAVWSLLE